MGIVDTLEHSAKPKAPKSQAVSMCEDADDAIGMLEALTLSRYLILGRCKMKEVREGLGREGKPGGPYCPGN